MLGLVRHAQVCPTSSKITISLERVQLFCLFVVCSYTSMEATLLSCCFSWVWSSMPKVLWNYKSSISLERVSDVVVICILLDVHWGYKNMLFWVVIGSQPIRLSDVLNLKSLKTIWGNKLIFCFHWNYKKYHAILGYDPKILLVN